MFVNVPFVPPEPGVLILIISIAPSTSTTGTINQVSITSGYSASELDHDSGDVMYVENRAPIVRAADQTENIKLIIEF